MKKIISRNVHFLGSKIRSQRKNLGLTLEDLSIRCIQVNPEIAPSISYLSLIETGNRVPSIELLELFSSIFQKDIKWFLDHSTDNIKQGNSSKFSFEDIDFEPNFLFSKSLIKKSIPALLSQSGVSGRQFAHILIRAYQEKNYNQFPDIEKIADKVGGKKFPMREIDILSICKKLNLKINWFKKAPFPTNSDYGIKIKSTLRSFYESNNKIYLNENLKNSPARLMYDLSLYIAHKVLHDGDGQISNHASAGQLGGSPAPFEGNTDEIKQKDILYAWRDFECSYFAGALLSSKVSMRRYLSANSYDINIPSKLNITTSTYMRRITSVSQYRHWHYFDAYQPGYLRAIYRGNGISMPWGNIRIVNNPCSQWGVFKMLKNSNKKKPLAQLSLLRNKKKTNIYSSISVNTKDISNTNHVLCLGLDLNPFLKKHIDNSNEFISDLENFIISKGGTSKLKKQHALELTKLSKILNIKWISESVENDVDIICSKNTLCPRKKRCDGIEKSKKLSWINQIKKEIVESSNK